MRILVPSHHTRALHPPALRPTSLGSFTMCPFSSIVPPLSVPSPFILSKQVSGCNFFILILTCSLTHLASDSLYLALADSCHVSLERPLSHRQGFLDTNPDATFSTPAPLPTQMLSRTGYSLFPGSSDFPQSGDNMCTRLNKGLLKVAAK